MNTKTLGEKWKGTMRAIIENSVAFMASEAPAPPPPAALHIYPTTRIPNSSSPRVSHKSEASDWSRALNAGSSLVKKFMTSVAPVQPASASLLLHSIYSYIFKFPCSDFTPIFSEEKTVKKIDDEPKIKVTLIRLGRLSAPS